MPKTVVLMFKDRRGRAPVLDWVDDIERAAQNKVFALVERLEEIGHEMRRPHAAPLTDEIRELRARVGRVNYRVLYAFTGKHRAVLLHGCTKESEVAQSDIETAVNRLALFRQRPGLHTYSETGGD